MLPLTNFFGGGLTKLNLGGAMLIIPGAAGERKTLLLSQLSCKSLESVVVCSSLFNISDDVVRLELAHLIPQCSNTGIIFRSNRNDQAVEPFDAIEKVLNENEVNKDTFVQLLHTNEFFRVHNANFEPSGVCVSRELGGKFAHLKLNHSKVDCLVNYEIDDLGINVKNSFLNERAIVDKIILDVNPLVVTEGVTEYARFFLNIKSEKLSKTLDSIRNIDMHSIMGLYQELVGVNKELVNLDLLNFLVSTPISRIKQILSSYRGVNESLINKACDYSKKLKNEFQDLLMKSKFLDIVGDKDVVKTQDVFSLKNVTYTNEPRSLLFSLIRTPVLFDSILPLAFDSKGAAVAGGLSVDMLRILSNSTYIEHIFSYPTDSFLGDHKRFQPILTGLFQGSARELSESDVYCTLRSSWRGVNHIFRKFFTWNGEQFQFTKIGSSSSFCYISKIRDGLILPVARLTAHEASAHVSVVDSFEVINDVSGLMKKIS